MQRAASDSSVPGWREKQAVPCPKGYRLVDATQWTCPRPVQPEYPKRMSTEDFGRQRGECQIVN